MYIQDFKLCEHSDYEDDISTAPCRPCLLLADSLMFGATTATIVMCTVHEIESTRLVTTVIQHKAS